MIELLREEKIKSPDYLVIRCEFYDLWNRLFLAKNQIDATLFKRFGRFWPLGKPLCQELSRCGLKSLWFIPKSHGIPLTSELILRSNQLWMIRAWEYPWAVLNSDISPQSRILDVGSGWSLFPLYLAQKGGRVESIDTDGFQMEILAPMLAKILKLRVEYSVDNALKLSVEDNTYDYVFCISVLEHLEEERENGMLINRHAKKLDRVAIKEFLRVIKPGGRVILTLDYANKHSSPRSFDSTYLTDLIGEFSGNLLKPLDNIDEIELTQDKEEEMRRLWAEFFPYDQRRPPTGALGIILTKD